MRKWIDKLMLVGAGIWMRRRRVAVGFEFLCVVGRVSGEDEAYVCVVWVHLQSSLRFLSSPSPRPPPTRTSVVVPINPPNPLLTHPPKGQGVRSIAKKGSSAHPTTIRRAPAQTAYLSSDVQINSE